MPCLLCLECSTREGSIALIEEGNPQAWRKPLAFKSWQMDFSLKQAKNSHSERLVTEIDQALKGAKKKLSSLSAIVLSIGPGRWTGLRAGSMVAKSLSFCLNIPIYPVNSLRVCAEDFLSVGDRRVIVAINGFKNQVYFAEFYSSEEGSGATLSTKRDKKTEEGKSGSFEGKPSIIPFSVYIQQMKLLIKKSQPPIKKDKMQTQNQTGIQVKNQTVAQIGDQMEKQTENQIGMQTEAQTTNQTEKQIGIQTKNQTENQTGEQIGTQTKNQTGNQMEEMTRGQTEAQTGQSLPPICVSDLMDFYPIPSCLKKGFLWKRPKPSALQLAKIVLKQKASQRKMLNWQELSLLYLRSPMDNKSPER